MGILEKLKTIASSDDGADNFKKMVDSDSSDDIPDELPSLPKLRSKQTQKEGSTTVTTVTTSLDAIKHAVDVDNEKPKQEASDKFDDLLELDSVVSRKESRVESPKVDIRSRAEEVAVVDNSEYEEDYDSEESQEEVVSQREVVQNDRSLYFKTLAAKINDDENHDMVVQELSSRPLDFMSKITESWKQDKHEEHGRKLKDNMNDILEPLQKLEGKWREMNIARDNLNEKIADVELEIEEKTIELNRVLRTKVKHVRSVKKTAVSTRKSAKKPAKKASKKSAKSSKSKK